MRDHPVVCYIQIPVACISACLALLVGIVWLTKRNHPVVKASNFQLSMAQLVVHFTLPVSVSVLQMKDNDPYSCKYRPMITTSQYIIIVALLSIRAELLVKAFQGSVRITKLDVFIVKSVSYGFVILAPLFYIALMVGVSSFTDFRIVVKKSEKNLSKEAECGDLLFFGIEIILVIVGFFICGSRAFRARNLPTKFNESRCIILCILISSMFMSVFLLMNLSTKRESLVVIYSALFFCVSNFTIILLIFGQKTFSILFDARLKDKKIFQQNVFKGVLKNVDRKISTHSSTIRSSSIQH